MLRGSVLPRILPALTINILIATLVTISHGDLFKLKITLTTIPFTLIGLPISIFLGSGITLRMTAFGKRANSGANY
jgi:putative membrane protein